MNRLGRFVAERRDALKITQGELARRCGHERSYITRLESGQVGNPSAKMVIHLAKALHVAPTAILSQLNGNGDDVSYVPAEVAVLADQELRPSQRRTLVSLIREYKHEPS